MMRYQRVSPDCLGLPNGRKPGIRICKDEDDDTAGRISSYPAFDAKPLRVRSGSGSASGSTNPSQTQAQDNHNHHFSASSDPLPSENPKSENNHEINGKCSPGDMLLQWGHNKRSRGSRAENRAVGYESSGHSRQHIKIQRRAAIAGAEKIAAAAAASAMPPPCGGGYTRGATLRACMPLRDSTGTYHNRSVEERSGGQSRSEKRSPPSPPDKPSAKTAAASNGFGPDPSSSMNHHHNNHNHHHESKNPPSDQDTVGSGSGGAAAGGAPEKVNLEQFEWPRIYLSLSRKEKEDDFLAMKGTKLPQRPKKRAKNIDKSLQYCFPGLWLSDLTRGRYEVREKKFVKKGSFCWGAPQLDPSIGSDYCRPISAGPVVRGTWDELLPPFAILHITPILCTIYTHASFRTVSGGSMQRRPFFLGFDVFTFIPTKQTNLF